MDEEDMLDFEDVDEMIEEFYSNESVDSDTESAGTESSNDEDIENDDTEGADNESEDDDDEEQNYQLLLTALSTILNIEQSFPSKAILGNLIVDYFELPADTYVYIIPIYRHYGEDENIFHLQIWYISNNNLIRFNEQNDSNEWYDNIFVVGKGRRVYTYDTEERFFYEIINVLNLPGRKELESKLIKGQVKADVETPFYEMFRENTSLSQIFLTEGNINCNFEFEVRRNKNLVNNYDKYTLGKLTEDFLDFSVGDNILIIWPDDVLDEDLDDNDRYDIAIYSISDRSLDAFNLTNDEFYWYQKIYVRGKKYGDYYYDTSRDIFAKYNTNVFENKIELSILSPTLRFTEDYLPVYYGITLSEFYEVPRNNLLVAFKTRAKNTFKLVYVPLEVGLEYGINWFIPEVCIVGKRTNTVLIQ